MKRGILLAKITPSEECKKARSVLTTAQVPFDELPAHSVWSEIEWPIPTFFADGKIYKGIEEIEKAPGELGYGKPN